MDHLPGFPLGPSTCVVSWAVLFYFRLELEPKASHVPHTPFVTASHPHSFLFLVSQIII